MRTIHAQNTKRNRSKTQELGANELSLNVFDFCSGKIFSFSKNNLSQLNRWRFMQLFGLCTCALSCQLSSRVLHCVLNVATSSCVFKISFSVEIYASKRFQKVFRCRGFFSSVSTQEQQLSWLDYHEHGLVLLLHWLRPGCKGKERFQLILPEILYNIDLCLDLKHCWEDPLIIFLASAQVLETEYVHRRLC